MGKRYFVSFLFIIVGFIIAIYFFVMGMYLFAGIGCGLVWGSFSFLNSMKIIILNDEIINENKKRFIKFHIENISNKNGEVNFCVNLIINNQVVASLISNTVYLNAHNRGFVLAEIPSSYSDCDEINYNVAKINCKKN